MTDGPAKLKSPGASDWLVIPAVGYQLRFPDLGTQFDLTRVHRKDTQTSGLLTVRVTFRGAHTVGDGIVSSAEFNCTSLVTRQQRAKHLADRTLAPEIDWAGLLEEFCLRILEADDHQTLEERLDQIPLTDEPTNELTPAGLPLLKRHPTIWFGDGGAAKSYLALYASTVLAQAGERVLYCDWEFDGEDHRRRLHRLVGPVPALPHLLYLRCEQALVRMLDRVHQAVVRHRITTLVCDSLGAACLGTPESAEAATGYFQALRELGPLHSLHLAHINRSEQGDRQPFGSAFWHNLARATWFLKRTDPGPTTDELTVGFYHRKANTGPLRPPFGMQLTFVGTETQIRPAPLEAPELVAKTPSWQRMDHELRDQPLITEDLSAKTGIPESTIRSNLTRFPDRFTRLPDGRIFRVPPDEGR